MNTRLIEARGVRERAAGRWIDMLAALAPALVPALSRPGRHVPCPVHGGTRGFRLFRDVDDTGGGVCNTCGTFPDGFALLMWFGIQTAHAAPDQFGLILAGGISAWFGVQAIVNMGGVVGLMPVTGLTLPFFSAGGSSLFVSMVAAGLLLNVARRVVTSPSGGSHASTTSTATRRSTAR